MKNDRDEFDTLTGFEVVLESLVYKIYNLFGRNALLSMTYQIGAGPGEEISKKILKERGNKKFEDPFEALKVLLKENEKFYAVKVKSIERKSLDDKNDQLIIEIYNRCFYRETLKKRPRLKIGGPLCRINKAYYETAFKKLTGYKCEISFSENHADLDLCEEKIIFTLPKK